MNYKCILVLMLLTLSQSRKLAHQARHKQPAEIQFMQISSDVLDHSNFLQEIQFLADQIQNEIAT